VIVPARNEAEQIATSMGSLLAQHYGGHWSIVLVDDESSDATAEIAGRMASRHGGDRLRIVRSRSLPAGWTGKLWALKQGIEAAMALSPSPDYLLLTDADIVHPPDSVARLVAHACRNQLVLTSLMVRLRCESFAERASVPAFIFFFQMLYPFAWVNRPEGPVAAAAGGCMLVRCNALEQIGGIGAIRGALIDDCALAAKLKRCGPIFLALSTRVRSIRAYPRAADVGRMVTRSAYAQLRYSPLLLLATVGGIALTYLVPPVIALAGSGIARVLALAAWGLMAIAFAPTLRLYQRSLLWGLALPLIALQYLVFTLCSAYEYSRGRGGSWKGRLQASAWES
jgi:hopene-associated glycosyltransferase HpnB